MQVVQNDLNYFPSKTKRVDKPASDIQEGFRLFKILYPEMASNCLAMTESEGYFIFSVDADYSAFIYIKVGEMEFRYFALHT